MEYQKLSPILVSIIGKGLNFKQGQKTGKNLKKIIQNSPNTKEISVAYKSKYKQKREKQVILLMITDGNKWHYLAVSSLSALLAKNYQILTEIFIASGVLIHTPQKIDLKNMKKYAINTTAVV